MSAANLLTMAGLITKDPNHSKYPSSSKYIMLSIAQSALARRLHLKLLRNITEEDAIAFTDSKSNAPTGFLRPVYMEVSGDKTPVELIEVFKLSEIQDSFFGGESDAPKYFIYSDNGTTKLKFRGSDTDETTNFYYIKEPSNIDSGVDEVIVGFDHLILDYFKYLFHMAEGQTELAMTALKHFEETVAGVNKEAEANGYV